MAGGTRATVTTLTRLGRGGTLRVVAGGEVRPPAAERRLAPAALVARDGSSGDGRAARGGWLGWAVAAEHDARALPGGIGLGHGGKQRHGVGMPRLRSSASVGPCSTILPRYITATRWAICRTTARSWAMKR